MRPEAFDIISNFSTLWQVVLGAFLATGGGLVANQLEWRVQARRRERIAALFLGELLSTLRHVIALADDTKKVGEPFGPITLRILQGARREFDIYDRNRENLLDIQNAALRARVHALVLRISMPLEGIFDASRELDALRLDLHARTVEETAREEIERRMALICERRESSYAYMMENVTRLGAIVADLEPLAGHTFAAIDGVAQASMPSVIAAARGQARDLGTAAETLPAPARN